MKILFVCIGNICRSPALHHLMKKKIQEEGKEDELIVDSCAISSWHLGNDMDPRMIRAAKDHGIVFDRHRAKLFRKKFFKEYDYIFVVTEELLDHLLERGTKEDAKKILLATHFSKSFKGLEIPDPYYGKKKDFQNVFRMMQTVIDETFHQLKKQL